MAKVTAEEYAKKWAQNLGSATQAVTAGVDKVTTAPGQLAVKKQDKMRANILKSIDDGTWARNTGAVPLEDWKNSMKQKGIPNIANGANLAISKQTTFAAKLLPFQDTLAAKVKGMPDLTIEDSVNRAATFIRGMAQFKK